jgi:hypothetical protein
MHMNGISPERPHTARPPRQRPAPQPSLPAPWSGGAEGNERLTAMTEAEVLGTRGIRLALLIASLLGGLVIALLTVHLAGKWEPIG